MDGDVRIRRTSRSAIMECYFSSSVIEVLIDERVGWRGAGVFRLIRTSALILRWRCRLARKSLALNTLTETYLLADKIKIIIFHVRNNRSLNAQTVKKTSLNFGLRILSASIVVHRRSVARSKNRMLRILI